MRKIYKTTNIALIFMLIGLFLWSEVAYALRPPLLFSSAKFENNALKNPLKINDFYAWIFKKGMKFGERITWWGKLKDRGQEHYGIDLYCYLDSKKQETHVEAGIEVTAVLDGKIQWIFKDVINTTVFVITKVTNGNDYLFYSYSHIDPKTLSIGQEIKQGENLGQIAKSSTSADPHLHYSVGMINKEAIDNEPMDFKKLNELVSSGKIKYFDPENFIITDNVENITDSVSERKLLSEEESIELAELVEMTLRENKLLLPKKKEHKGYLTILPDYRILEVLRLGPLIFVCNSRWDREFDKFAIHVMRLAQDALSGLCAEFPCNILFVDRTRYEIPEAFSSYSTSTVETMLKYARYLSNATLIDFGSGNGLLSLVALSLGARSAVLIDNDPQMLGIAKEILLLNGYSEQKQDFFIVDTNISDITGETIGKMFFPLGPIVAVMNIPSGEAYKKALTLACSIKHCDVIICGGLRFDVIQDERQIEWNRRLLNKHGYACRSITFRNIKVLVGISRQQNEDDSISFGKTTFTITLPVAKPGQTLGEKLTHNAPSTDL